MWDIVIPSLESYGYCECLYSEWEEWRLCIGSNTLSRDQSHFWVPFLCPQKESDIQITTKSVNTELYEEKKNPIFFYIDNSVNKGDDSICIHKTNNYLL